MPFLKASIKHARQSEERRARRQPFKTRMKTHMKMIHDYVKEGKISEATKIMPLTFKYIDTAAKKKIIHWKNAGKKKSQLSRLVSTPK